MRARVTLKDIARETGLSVSSVSLALRGDTRFPADTIARIRNAATSLGYVYNQAAADLRMSRTNQVAVCLGDLTNPIFNDMLLEAETEIERRGKRLLLGITRENRARQADFLHQALQVGCEALLLCPAYGTTCTDLDAILRVGDTLAISTALFFRSVEGFDAPQIVMDEVRSGRLSARAAIDAGHRNLHWIGGGRQTSAAFQRQSGAVAEIVEAGLAPPGLHPGPTSRAYGFAKATELLATHRGEIAFLCFSDLIAMGVLAACHAAGRRVGHDVSVVGCDDMDEVKYAIPPLTTIRIDLKHIVATAMQAATTPDFPRPEAFEPVLIQRESLCSL